MATAVCHLTPLFHLLPSRKMIVTHRAKKVKLMRTVTWIPMTSKL